MYLYTIKNSIIRKIIIHINVSPTKILIYLILSALKRFIKVEDESDIIPLFISSPWLIGGGGTGIECEEEFGWVKSSFKFVDFDEPAKIWLLIKLILFFISK